MKTGRSGIGFSHAPGEIVDLSEPEARRLIAAGQAVAVDPPARNGAPEAATVAPSEAAVLQHNPNIRRRNVTKRLP